MEHITSRKNPWLTALRRLNTTPAARREAGRFLCEGPKLVGECLKWGWPVEAVVGLEDKLPAVPGGARTVAVPEDILGWLSDVEAPQGVLAVCRLPDTALPGELAPGRYLVLDGVQDPGNLGTVWRTADAFGAAGLILTGACADPFGPKTVRATMGACFRLPVWQGERAEVRDKLSAAGVPLYATALREDTEDVRSVSLNNAAVVIGSEGKGVSDELLGLCDRTLKIPMEGRCESLNAAVAAAVVLWEMYR